MIWIGIDPGNSGGIAALDDFGRPFDLGLQKLSETPLDIVEFVERVTSWGDCFAVIEKVHSSPQMGVTSAFTFGRSLGFLHGLLTAFRIPFDEVSPQRWQKAMDCLSKGDKNVTKNRAQQLFPNEKISHAIADALLIAEYGRRTHKDKEILP